MKHKSSTDDLLVCVDDGVEGQTVSPTWREVFKSNSILVSAKNVTLLKTWPCIVESTNKNNENSSQKSAISMLNLSMEQNETN